jgi:hypothetical protein
MNMASTPAKSDKVIIAGHWHAITPEIKKKLYTNLYWVLSQINAGDRVGMEYSQITLKENQPNIDNFVQQIRKRGLKKFLDSLEPTSADLVFDDIIAAAVLEKKGIIIPIDSERAQKTVVWSFILQRTVREYLTPPQKQSKTWEKTLEELDRLKKRFTLFPKIKNSIQAIKESTEEKREEKVRQLLKLAERIDTEISLPLRDKYMADKINRKRCTIVCVGELHVPGIQKLLNENGIQTVTQTVMPAYKKPRFRGSSWKKYRRRKLLNKIRRWLSKRI